MRLASLASVGKRGGWIKSERVREGEEEEEGEKEKEKEIEAFF